MRPMDDINGGKSKHALRLALSYRDKAQALSRECEEARAAGRVQDAEYLKLQEFYARHAQHAQERVDLLHQEHRRRAETLRESIQDTARRQAELGDLAAARDIGVRKANRLNRRYQATIGEQRAAYQVVQRLASIEDVNEVGGFIDRPLDQYQADARQHGITLPGIDRLVATAVAVLGSLSIFLPWMSLAGEVRPLAGVPSLLGFEERIGSVGVIAVLLVFLVLPLTGAIFAWIENPRRSGSGMVATGLGMLLLTALALLVAGMLTGERILLPNLLRGLRLGALLYVVAAVQFMLLGVRRARVSDRHGNRGGVLVAFTGIVIALAVIAISFYLAAGTTRASLDFEFSQPDPATGTVTVFVTNDGDVPANVYVPWPEGGAESIPPSERSMSFGFSLFIHEGREAKTPFRLFPASQDCWRQNGRLLTAGTPVQVLPDTVATFELLPYEARQEGVNPQAVRITASDGNGTLKSSFEVALPSLASQ